MRPLVRRLCRSLPALAMLLPLACGDGDKDGGTGPDTKPDTEPPFVALTAPAAAASLLGVVIITADASDNNGVVSVQFHLDGVKLGTDDLDRPYLAAWETRNVTNGPHTLTAVARDGSGNVSTSAPVTVAVANPPPGNLVLTVTTAGPPSSAFYSYTVRLDGVENVIMPANASKTFTRLSAGAHTVDLDHVWPFCTVTGERPRLFEVPAGGTVAVTLEVACVPGPAGRIAHSRFFDYADPLAGIITPADGSAALLAEPGLSPSWSADGTQLVFLRVGPLSDSWDLHRVQADGSGVVFLANLPLLANELDWGPASTIVFTAERALEGGGTVRDLYRIDSDGSDLRPLFTDAADRFAAALSPDGAQVAFSLWSASRGEASLWVAHVDGGNRHRLTSGFVDAGASWSPDGTQIAFSRDVAWVSRILLIAPDGTGLRNVTDRVLEGFTPAWSPNGEWIAHSTGSGELWISRVDGTFSAPIGFGALPDWGP